MYHQNFQEMFGILLVYDDLKILVHYLGYKMRKITVCGDDDEIEIQDNDRVQQVIIFLREVNLII